MTDNNIVHIINYLEFHIEIIKLESLKIFVLNFRIANNYKCSIILLSLNKVINKKTVQMFQTKKIIPHIFFYTLILLFMFF